MAQSKRRDNKTIDARVEAVLRKAEKENRRTELRVVHWIVDGRDTGPKLEKRDFFIKDGQIKTGKCVGFNKEDWQFIVDNQDEIALFFK